jgi:hypothetical protein
MPNPRKGETKEDYIAKFMASPEARKDFPDPKQRAAVAYSKWKEHGGKDNALSNAIGRFAPLSERAKIGASLYGFREDLKNMARASRRGALRDDDEEESSPGVDEDIDNEIERV